MTLNSVHSQKKTTFKTFQTKQSQLSQNPALQLNALRTSGIKHIKGRILAVVLARLDNNDIRSNQRQNESNLMAFTVSTGQNRSAILRLFLPRQRTAVHDVDITRLRNTIRQVMAPLQQYRRYGSVQTRAEVLVQGQTNK